MQMFGVTGESLGTIGAQAEVKEQKKPEWQRLLAAKPSISVRKGIAWGTDPPTEPTSTLVLTSSKSYFIDIRFSLLGPTPTSPPHYWAFAGVCESSFPSTALGPAPETTVGHKVSFPCSIHTIWTRLLDSRGDLTTPDQGTNYLLHNGDCLEVGEMVNPETDTLQSYQELWTSPQAQDSHEAAMPNSAFSTTVATSARDSNSSPPQSHRPPTSHIPSPNPPPKVRVVLALLHRTPSPTAKPQGLILRIGPYCQGIIEIPSATTTTAAAAATTTIPNNSAVRSRKPENNAIVRVERWTLQPNTTTNQPPPTTNTTPPTATATAENANTDSVWSRDPRSDYHEDTQLGLWMPCLWCCEEERTTTATMTTTTTEEKTGLVVGDEMGRDGFAGSWRVVEVEG